MNKDNERNYFDSAVTPGIFHLVLIGGVFLAALLLSDFAAARDWSSWRGPENGGFSRETDLPSSWTKPDAGGENLLWSQPYGARSTPVAMLDRVYLLNVAGEGEKQQERVMCFDAKTGNVVWEHRFNVFLTDIPNRRVGWSSPAADSETGYVYVHGVQGLLKCLDRNGDIVWERSLTEEFGRISGYGGRTHTPIIDEDRVIISFLNSSWGPQSKGTHRYVALDKKTGSVIWWAAPAGRPLDTTYSCPVISVVGGIRLLIAGNADGNIYAMKARTGESVWKFNLSKRGINSSVVARDGLVYVSHSEENLDKTSMGRVVCIDASGTGDVTRTHERWRDDAVTAGYASPALDKKNLYIADNSANVYCYDAMTGKRKWKHNVGTVMKGSPVVGDGKLYIGAVNGVFSILEIGDGAAKTLNTQEFTTPDGRILEINGAACVANGRVYFATSQAFYCLGKKTWKGRSDPLPKLSKEAVSDVQATPAHLQILPADVKMYAGQDTPFRARVFDANGRMLRVVKADWSLAGLSGTLSGAGRLSIAESAKFEGGHVIAKFGELEAKARVRIVPSLPIQVDFENVPLKKSPPGWIGATGIKFGVVDLDGNKAFSKYGDKPKFMLANCYFGFPEWSDYTLQADVMGTEKRRSLPNIGILVNRYNLSLMGNTQRVRIVSWAPMPRIEKKLKFAWKPKTWYRMKLRVDREGDQALVRGKVWERDQPEPKDWTVTIKDPSPNRQGSPGLHGYSAGSTDRSAGTQIFWDNIVITPND